MGHDGELVEADETLPDKYRSVAIAFRLNASAIPATAIADELEALWRAVTSTGEVVVRLGVDRAVAREGADPPTGARELLGHLVGPGETLPDKGLSSLEEQFIEWWASEFGGEPNFDHGPVVDIFVGWKGGLSWER